MMIQMIPLLGDGDKDESLELRRRPEVMDMREEMEVEAIGDLDGEEVD